MQTAASAVTLLIAILLSAIFVSAGILDRIPNEAVAGTLLALILVAPPLVVRLRERPSGHLPASRAHRPARAA